MDLRLSDDQQLFADTTRRFLKERWPIDAVRRHVNDPGSTDRDSLLKDAAELGWPSLLIDWEKRADGIADSGPANLAIVAELAGAALYCTPVLPSAVVVYALLRATPLSAHLRGVLDRLLEGQQCAAWALAGFDHSRPEAGRLTAAPTGGGYRLDGVVSPVECARQADHLLVAADTAEGLTQFLVPARGEGVSIIALEALDLTRELCRLELTEVAVPAEAVLGKFGAAEAEIGAQSAFAVALQCAQTVGAAQRAFDITLAYVKERKSFGRTIGSYQALKHRLADMLLWLESAKAVTTAAVNALGEAHGTMLASVAKAYVADYCPRIARECLQLHGGIGFTWEHDMHLYLRRIETDAALYGNVDEHRTRLARLAVFPRTGGLHPA